MITYRIQYPGDPITVVTEMTGAEFLGQTEQPREIVITAAGQPETRIPVVDVLCDHCNAEIGPEDLCALALRRLYCRPCTDQWLRPYQLP